MINLIDAHTHTISSGHAYSSLCENIKHASSIGLKYYGLSDHAPNMPGGPQLFHITNQVSIPRIIDGVIVLRGVELNILDEHGNVDIADEFLKNLDYTIVSLHTPCIESLGIELNTKACVNAMKHQYTTILGHPDDSRFPIDYETVIKAAKEFDVLVEINSSSLNPNAYRQGAKGNYKTIIELCNKYRANVILDSDAHICYNVGNVKNSINIANEYGLDQELIVNYNEKLIEKYFLSHYNKECK